MRRVSCANHLAMNLAPEPPRNTVVVKPGADAPRRGAAARQTRDKELSSAVLVTLVMLKAQ